MKKSEKEIRRYIRLANRVIRDATTGSVNIKNVNLGEYGLSKQEYRFLVDTVNFLRKNFPNKSYSWIMRAIVRAFYVRESGENRWIVEGLSELGDLYSYYVVMFFDSTNRYSCSCYNTSYGYVRRRKICTHIAAVMLYRRWRGDLSYYVHKQISGSE